MRVEVHSAADFLMKLLRVKLGKDLTNVQLEKFKGSLADLMLIRYQSHWYPDLPTKGSAYRCIRINGKLDPMIEQAGVSVGLNAKVLRKMLPKELTMWIDPDEVAYRIGENGSICVLFDAVHSSYSPSSDIDSNEELLLEPTRTLDISDISVIDYLVELPNSKSTNSSPSSSPPYFNYHNNRHNLRYNNNQNKHFHQQPYQNPDLYRYNNFNSSSSKVRTQC